MPKRKPRTLPRKNGEVLASLTPALPSVSTSLDEPVDYSHDLWERFQSALLPPGSQPLGPKMAEFIHQLLRHPTLDTIGAANEAALSPQERSEAAALLDRPRVKDLLEEELQSRLAGDWGVDRNAVGRFLQEAMAMAAGKAPVRVCTFHQRTASFVQGEALQTDVSAMVRAAAEIGKLYNLAEGSEGKAPAVQINLDFGHADQVLEIEAESGGAVTRVKTTPAAVTGDGRVIEVVEDVSEQEELPF